MPKKITSYPNGLGANYLKLGSPAVQKSATLTPASVGATTVAEQTFTVAGLVTTDRVMVTMDAAPANAVFISNARVSAANSLTIQFVNITAGALTPMAGNYTVWVVNTV